MTASGQYSQQRKHEGFFCLAGVHLLWCMTGVRLRHSPVLPASPMAGDDSSQICLQSLVPMVLSFSVQLGYLKGLFNGGQIDIYSVIRKSLSYYPGDTGHVYYLGGTG